MLTLYVTGETYDELKQKAFQTLGLTLPAQMELPFEGATAPRAEIEAAIKEAKAPKPKKEKAPKAETPAPVIEAVEALAEESQEAVVEETQIFEEKTLADCQDALREILRVKSTPAGIKLLGEFGIAKLTMLDKSKFGEFYVAAKKVLAQ